MNEPESLGPPPILVEIGSGELIDKITILQIKAERLKEPSKLENVRRELAVLEAARVASFREALPELARLEAGLKAVNLRLWQIEDNIRLCERRQDFGSDFVALARAVYLNNDQRAAIKRRINDSTGARIVEEKSYAEGAVLEAPAEDV